MFATVPMTDEMSSKLIGLDIYNKAKQNIGTIKDISFNAYIVAVGGFLSMGEHYVAIRPNAITVTFDLSDKKWHATMDRRATDRRPACGSGGLTSTSSSRSPTAWP